mgnify:CR=1 FL=1
MGGPGVNTIWILVGGRVDPPPKDGSNKDGSALGNPSGPFVVMWCSLWLPLGRVRDAKGSLGAAKGTPKGCQNEPQKFPRRDKRSSEAALGGSGEALGRLDPHQGR